MITKIEDFLKSEYGKIMLGAVLSLLTVIILGFCAFLIKENTAVNILFILFGGVIGWIIGIYLSPKSDKEKLDFSEFGKAVSAFAGGFLVAKFDLLFNELLDSGNIYSEWFVGRFLLFGVSLCLGMLTTFYGRKYIIEIQTKKKNKGVSV